MGTEIEKVTDPEFLDVARRGLKYRDAAYTTARLKRAVDIKGWSPAHAYWDFKKSAVASVSGISVRFLDEGFGGALDALYKTALGCQDLRRMGTPITGATLARLRERATVVEQKARSYQRMLTNMARNETHGPYAELLDALVKSIRLANDGAEGGAQPGGKGGTVQFGVRINLT